MPMLTLLAVAATPQQPVMPPAPQTPVRMLVDLRPGAVTCDGGMPRAIDLATPAPAAAAVPVGQAIAPYRFTFRIDADGRVLGITSEPRMTTGVYFVASDLQPALAASRFAAGAPQARCTITYDAVANPLATAPIDLVRRYLTLPHDAAWFESEIRERGRSGPGDDCYTGKPAVPLLRAFPDPDAMPQARGTMAMTVAGFDIDRAGRPVWVRTLQSDGNAAVDAEVRRAVAKSRFKAGAPRTGCFLPYFRRQPIPLAAPEAPPLDRSSENGCPAGDTRWAYLPKLVFPRPFWHRAIEGWAVVRYDLAPWGQTGNVTVIASEPAAAFGEQAKQIIVSARRSSSAKGATGCVERVRFKMPQQAEGNDPPPPPPPIID